MIFVNLPDAAVAAGGRESRPPQDPGFLYGHAFEDLDGHLFEPMFMDLEAALAADSNEAQPAS